MSCSVERKIGGVELAMCRRASLKISWSINGNMTKMVAGFGFE